MTGRSVSMHVRVCGSDFHHFKCMNGLLKGNDVNTFILRQKSGGDLFFLLRP